MKRIILGAAALSALLTGGCTGPAPTPTPTGPVATGPAAPSPAATPSLCPRTPGATPTPCTQAQLDELVAKAALYAEAEQVYRRFFEEDGKLGMAGKDASPAVLELLGGPFVESYKAERKSLIGVTSNGYGDIRYVKPAPGQSEQGSEVALSVCADGSRYVAYRDGNQIGHLGTRQSVFFFKTVDGSLRIWWQLSTKVSSC
nr:hypothetical protein [Propionibacterium sp.]